MKSFDWLRAVDKIVISERFTKQRNNKQLSNELFSINNKTIIKFRSLKHAKWYFASEAIKSDKPANLIRNLLLYFAISQICLLMLNVTTDESVLLIPTHWQKTHIS